MKIAAGGHFPKLHKQNKTKQRAYGSVGNVACLYHMSLICDLYFPYSALLKFLTLTLNAVSPMPTTQQVCSKY